MDPVLSGLPLLHDVWRELLAEHSGKTEVVSYTAGVVTINVFDHILYCELNGFRRGELLRELQQRLPDVPIKNVVFRNRLAPQEF